MKTLRLILGAIVVLAIAVTAYVVLKPVGSDPVPPIAGAPADLAAAVSHGEYLTRAADCFACHTIDHGKPYAGGRAFKLPFGTIYATNITPDPETGIGAMSDDDFVRAVRQGIGPEGHLYPAMPYTSYAGLSRQDVLAIKAYLMSLRPVHQATPQNQLAFPFNQRWGMTFWNVAFFDDHRFVPDAARDETWNRGAYLATALGHCGECHTPRNIGFAMQSRDYLAGTITNGWKAYNTTSDDSYGVGGWSDEQLTQFLAQGHAQGRSSASGPMAEVVEYSLQYLTPQDMRALVAYLRGVSAVPKGTDGTIDLHPAAAQASSALLPGAADPHANAAGARLFEGDCAGCHQWNGGGRESDFASLVGSHAVNDAAGTALVQVILNGSTIDVGGQKQLMPGFGKAYSDADVASVANYVIAQFGAKQGAVTAAQVAAARKTQ